MSIQRMLVSQWRLTVAILLGFGLSGCQRAAPAIEKALVKQGGKAVVKQGEKAAARSFQRGAGTVARQENRLVQFVKEEGPGLAGDVAELQVDDWLKRQSQAPAPVRGGGGSAQRFPYPPSSVKPLPGGNRRVDPVTGNFTVPNNYGGCNLYDASGAPIGFSARNKITGQLDIFDRHGNRQ